MFLFLLLFLFSELVGADDFSTLVNKVKLKKKDAGYKLNANIDFNLSPTAKEALQKGIALSWRVIVKVQQKGSLWDTTIQEIELSYRIRKHALLHLYSVKQSTSLRMFSTLTAAMNSMSKIRKLAIIDLQSLQSDASYQVAVKVQFNREALPVPLRPISYFNSQWALSSDWSVWQLQN